MNINNIRKDFPILSNVRNGHQLIYFDNAATVQKPSSVIKAIADFYAYDYAPIHRGVYTLAEMATEKYEQARTEVARFINAQSHEIIFTAGATDSINLIVHSWATDNIKEGDVILLNYLEHHSNILPWLELAEKNKLIIEYIPIKATGELDYEAYLKLFELKPRLVAVTGTSNVLGTHNNLEFIIKHAHAHNALVLVDVAQTIAHEKIDVKYLNADFLVFSAHKIMGPTGLGIAYIKEDLHYTLKPYKFGGGMVYNLSLDKCHSWKNMPYMLEAGSPPVAQAIGLAAALEYYRKIINYKELRHHEALLCARLIEGLQTIDGIKIWGNISELKASGNLVTFTYTHAHAHDIAAYCDLYNICVRAGHHCAQPLHSYLGITSSVRVSFYCYNTVEEVDILVKILQEFTVLFRK